MAARAFLMRIPATDGEYLYSDSAKKSDLNEFYNSYKTGHFTCWLEDSSGSLVVGAGTVTIQGKINAKQYAPAPANSTIDLSLSTENIGYTPPVFEGSLKDFKLTLAGVSGGQFLNCEMWRAD